MLELYAITMAVRTASGEPTYVGPNSGRRFSDEERITFARFVEILVGVYDEMQAERARPHEQMQAEMRESAKRNALNARKRAERALATAGRNILAEQDFGTFQRRMLLLATVAAVASALASIGSLLVAYMQFRGGR